jgi:mannose-1-phosphate guanylyltransferase / phosphomannomutase
MHGECMEQPAIFLDRDGTLLEYRPYLSDPADYVLMPDAKESIQAIKRAGFLALVVTNQPMIAMGLCSVETVERMHRRLLDETSGPSGRIDGIFYCPHRGTSKEADKTQACDCRKPATGMFDQARGSYSLNPRSSAIIGDSWRDIQWGRNVGCSLSVGLAVPGSSLGDFRETSPDAVFTDLRAAVDFCLNSL